MILENLKYLIASSVDVGSGGEIKFNGFANPSGGVLGLFGTAADILIFITASISIVMIIVGGLLFVISAGNSSNTKRARETIIYAVVGFVISLAAYAIISFVKGVVK